MRFIPAIGDYLIDRYYVEEIIDSTQETAVLKCLDTRLEVPGAVKLLINKPNQPITEESKARFLKAARTQARLNHPNIVHVTNIESHREHTFSVMEYLQGVTLEQHISDLKIEMSPKEVIEIFISIIDAVSMAHTMGIMHKNMCPSNVILNQQGSRLSPRILNFAARKLSQNLSPHRHLCFLAPEQIKDFENASVESDIFSLCAMMYYVFTHHPPVIFDHYDAYLEFFANNEAFTYFPTSIPQNFAPLIKRGLNFDPSKRFKTAAQLVEGLKRLGGKFTLSANLTIEAPKSYPGHTPSQPINYTNIKRPTNTSNIVIDGDIDKSSVLLETPPEEIQLPAELRDFFELEVFIRRSRRGCLAIVHPAGASSAESTVIKFLHQPSDLEREVFVEACRRSEYLAQTWPYIQMPLAIYPDQCAVITPNVPRQSLWAYVDANGAFEQTVATQSFILLAQVMEAAHRAGFVNANLKPSNVFFEDRQGTVVPVIYDFGQRLYADRREALSSKHYPYIPPELGYNLQNANAQTDIFAFGMLLNYVLLGKSPYEATDPQELANEIAQYQQAPSLATLRPELDPNLIRVINWCTAFDPSQRYQNFSDVLRDLYVVFENLAQNS